MRLVPNIEGYIPLLAAMKKRDPADKKYAMREMIMGDLYFLLRFVCNRDDFKHPFLFRMCREVQNDPYDILNLWARDHRKDLADDTPMLTANRGWTTHGDLTVGDTVYSDKGNCVPIIAVSPRYTDSPCYRVKFTDGAEITAGAGHLWRVRHKIRRRIKGTSGRCIEWQYENVTTEALSMMAGRRDVGTAAPLEMPHAENLPIDPYTFGAWLGDGHSAGGRLTCAHTDSEIISHIREGGVSVLELKNKGKGDVGLYALDPGTRGQKNTGMTCILRGMGVKNNKHIPPEYLGASIVQRMELLRGLMDTDGCCDTRGTATFVNINESLARNVYELAAGLGMRPRFRYREATIKGKPYPVFEVSFQAHKDRNPFFLQRKADRAIGGNDDSDYLHRGTRLVSEIIPVAPTATKCIQVEGGMYLAGRELVPTHNSTIITFGFLMQRILGELSQGRHFTAGIFSHTRALAQGFLFQLKSEFENNELLKELFPDVLYANPVKESPLWSIEKGLILKRRGNPKEASIESWGVVEGQPIGRHFTELYYDDVVVPSSVTTPAQIAKTTEMLRMSFNLGSKGTKKLWAGTRYHYADSYGFLMEETGLRARIVQATVDGKPEGKPVFLSQEELRKKYNDMGQYVFSTQMLLSPVPDAQQEFKAEWWKEYYGEYDPSVKKGNRYLLIDPSSGKKGTAGRETDYTVIVAIECRDDDNIYVLSMLRQRLNLKQRTEALFDFHAEFKPERLYGVRYEEVGMQADIEHIREEQKRRRYMFDITPVPARISKEDRIRRLVPYFCTGRIIFPERIDCLDENRKPINLVEIFRKEEYLTFPFSKHDDMMDALSRLAEEKFPLEFPKPNPSAPMEDFHSGGSGASEDGFAY